MPNTLCAAQPGFEQLARELSAPLLRYLTRQVGDATIAEDLRQETLLKIERGLQHFAGRAEVKTWAFAIASNVVIDYLRQPAHRLKLVAVEQAADVSDPSTAVDDTLVMDEMNVCVRELRAHTFSPAGQTSFYFVREFNVGHQADMGTVERLGRQVAEFT